MAEGVTPRFLAATLKFKTLPTVRNSGRTFNSHNDRGHAVVNLFRVSGSKIVEHSDVIQNVLEPKAKNNTMF